MELNPSDRHDFFVELARDSYHDKMTRKGYKVSFYNNNTNQLYYLENKTEQIIVIRGTDELKDVYNDALQLPIHGVHYGFYKRTQAIYLMIFHKVQKNKPLYLVGHSSGGANVLILSTLLNHDNVTIYTYGCPKVGLNSFIDKIKAKHFRFIKCGDFVTWNPVYPYRHHSQAIYLDNVGNVISTTKFKLFYDAIKYGFTKNNHAIDVYAQDINNLTQLKE